MIKLERKNPSVCYGQHRIRNSVVLRSGKTINRLSEYEKLAESFLDKIAPPYLPYQKRLFNILTARGFLLDIYDNTIYLSDNSFMDRSSQDITDRDFLARG